eukprot:s4633_g6.t2
MLVQVSMCFCVPWQTIGFSSRARQPPTACLTVELATPFVARLREEVAKELDVLACQIRLTRAGAELADDSTLAAEGDKEAADVEAMVVPILDFPCRDRYPGAATYVACSDASAVPTFPCPEDERCLPEADLRCSVWGPPAVQGHLVPAVATSLPSDAGIQGPRPRRGRWPMAPVIESAGVRLLIVLCVVVCTVLLSNQYLEELLPQVKVSAEVAWGLVSKGYGLLYVMVFASFHSQVVPLCGKKGVSPVSDLLSRASKDFPGYRKVLYFPTLLWLDDSDAMLVGLNGVGLLAGLLAICGGLAGWLGLLVARVCLQSLAVAGEFWYVWDYMVLEAGALVLLLPTSAPLPALGLTSTPAPCVALAWQFLAIRLMLGFAKTKFGGARVFEDNLYLQGFFIWQLLPNRLSWYLHHAPLWFLRAGYVFMLYVEVILPLCAFWGGAPRYIAACGLIALMFGIYLTGNWGTFNFGYAIVCVGLFDLDVAYSSFFSARELGDCFWSDILLRPLMTVYMFLSLIYCVFDTWTNTSWPYYYWEIIPEFQLHGLIGLIRLLGPFRLISSYGVFPPEALPQVRTTLVYEGSQDGTWSDEDFCEDVKRTASAAPFAGKAKMADAEKLPPLDDDTASGPERLEAPKGAVKISPGRFWQARAEEHVYVKDAHADSTDKMLQKQAEILKRLDHQTELLSLLVSKPPLGMRRISLERPEVAACNSSGCNSGCHSNTSQQVRAKVNYDEPARPKRTSFTPHLFKTFSQTELSRRREAKAVSAERSVTAAMSSEAPPYCAERLVKHPVFDLFFTVVVITNSIFIGVELQLSMSTGCRSIPVQAVQYVYTLLFTLELVLRVLGQGPSLFWRDEWTWAWLDLFIVATSLWEVAVDVYYYSQGNTDLTALSGMSSLKAFRIIRITRLIKAVRLVRVLRFVMAFRTLITSILHTLKSLFWALMLLALIIYVFAVIFTQAVNDVLKDPESGLSQADIDASVLYFGTLPETMLSLFMSICGGVSWENVLAPLKSISVIWVLLYLFYIAFTYFAVMNVVTAVFCQSAIDGAQNDHASKVHAILSNKEEHLGKIRALFSQFGAEDGVITFDLFREKIKSPEVRHYFQTLGLDVWDAWSFFKLLDEDAGGAVEIEEFLMGCLRLRGQATALDVGKIINDQQWLIRNQGKFHAYMEVLYDLFDQSAAGSWEAMPEDGTSTPRLYQAEAEEDPSSTELEEYLVPGARRQRAIRSGPWWPPAGPPVPTPANESREERERREAHEAHARALSLEVSNAVSGVLARHGVNMLLALSRIDQEAILRRTIAVYVRALAPNESGHPWTLWVTDDDSELAGEPTSDQEAEPDVPRPTEGDEAAIAVAAALWVEGPAPSVATSRLVHLRLLFEVPLDILCIYQFAWNLQKVELRGAKNKTDAMLRQRRQIWQHVDKWIRAIPQRNGCVVLGDFNVSVLEEQHMCGAGLPPSTSAAHPDQGALLEILRAHRCAALNAWSRPGPANRTFLSPHAGEQHGTQIDFIVTRGHLVDHIAKQAAPFDAAFVPVNIHHKRQQRPQLQLLRYMMPKSPVTSSKRSYSYMSKPD